MTDHDPYWPLVQRTRSDGVVFQYHWGLLQWVAVERPCETRPDVEPGTDWTSEKSL